LKNDPKERQRAEWMADLAKTEEEIETLKQVKLEIIKTYILFF